MVRLWLIVFTLMVAGCGKLYWHRNKVAANPRKQKLSVALVVENNTPAIFEKDFNDRLEAICKNELERMGYLTVYKTTPNLLAILRIDLDSFILPMDTTNKQLPRTVYYYTTSMLNGQRLHGVKAIMFDYQIIFSKDSAIKWKEQNDIYYFDDVKRNTNRALGMVKYTFRNGK